MVFGRRDTWESVPQEFQDALRVVQTHGEKLSRKRLAQSSAALAGALAPSDRVLVIVPCGWGVLAITESDIVQVLRGSVAAHFPIDRVESVVTRGLDPGVSIELMGADGPLTVKPPNFYDSADADALLSCVFVGNDAASTDAKSEVLMQIALRTLGPTETRLPRAEGVLRDEFGLPLPLTQSLEVFGRDSLARSMPCDDIVGTENVYGILLAAQNDPQGFVDRVAAAAAAGSGWASRGGMLLVCEFLDDDAAKHDAYLAMVKRGADRRREAGFDDRMHASPRELRHLELARELRA